MQERGSTHLSHKKYPFSGTYLPLLGHKSKYHILRYDTDEIQVIKRCLPRQEDFFRRVYYKYGDADTGPSVQEYLSLEQNKLSFSPAWTIQVQPPLSLTLNDERYSLAQDSFSSIPSWLRSSSWSTALSSYTMSLADSPSSLISSSCCNKQ